MPSRQHAPLLGRYFPGGGHEVQGHCCMMAIADLLFVGEPGAAAVSPLEEAAS